MKRKNEMNSHFGHTSVTVPPSTQKELIKSADKLMAMAEQLMTKTTTTTHRFRPVIRG
jgi:hypothetical protein